MPIIIVGDFNDTFSLDPREQFKIWIQIYRKGQSFWKRDWKKVRFFLARIKLQENEKISVCGLSDYIATILVMVQ